MLKRIAVFAVLVLCYALTGVALNASQANHGPALMEEAAE